MPRKYSVNHYEIYFKKLCLFVEFLFHYFFFFSNISKFPYLVSFKLYFSFLQKDI